MVVSFPASDTFFFLSVVQRSGEPDEFPVAQESDWLGIGLLQTKEEKIAPFLDVPIGDPFETLMFASPTSLVPLDVVLNASHQRGRKEATHFSFSNKIIRFV